MAGITTTNARRKCLTERYFVSCTAPAEISVLVSVSAVGNNYVHVKSWM